MQATYFYLTLDKILIAEKKSQQALAVIEKEPIEWGKLTGQALAYHALGREQDSNTALDGLIAKSAAFVKSNRAIPVSSIHVFIRLGPAFEVEDWYVRSGRRRHLLSMIRSR